MPLMPIIPPTLPPTASLPPIIIIINNITILQPLLTLLGPSQRTTSPRMRWDGSLLNSTILPSAVTLKNCTSSTPVNLSLFLAWRRKRLPLPLDKRLSMNGLRNLISKIARSAF
ncbi:hypothetical protein EMPG_15510 [Blastomyces silverae]|uniref:Uncharacterized protein n=1 Tax=Blastomyces silverae TaxID=2060906 RepID=A0A0H1BCI2_9EURO|nr:hypothetical protein EMPG_15510 [Blastomyces silverae]